ncbi:MAG: M48 family metalloprotease [Acidobacteriia bacterium]|nr:M48 family metalloprotease [Terriglobia bacterium]
MRYRVRIFAAILLLVLASSALAQQRAIKPGFNLFSKEQDIQMGREYAAQIERQMPVVRNAELDAYLQRIGRKLASQPEAGNYPYTFKLVRDKNINAFALPGGPTFVHTGLIAAAETEAQLAGVMAHEIAHVALRHGTNQASKAQLIQLPAMLAGSLLGDSGSLAGTLAQIGIGLGANSVLLKYSRNAERDADLLGARMMSRAGYNPIEMARFFEKLQAETGKGNAFTSFLSDHPNPGDRVKAVQEEIRYLPRNKYTADTGELPRIQKSIQGLPEPPKPRGQSRNTGNPDPAASRPSGRFKQFQGREVAFQYPDNWEVHGEPGSDQVTVAPVSAVFGQQLGYALIVSFSEMPRNTDLRAGTEQLLKQLQKENPSMKVTQTARRTEVNKYQGMVTRLESDSPYTGAREVDLVVTLDRPGGLFFLVFIAPDKEYPAVQRTFEQILQSVRFAN